DGVRAASRQRPQAFLDPPATGRPGDGCHGLSLPVRELTALLRCYIPSIRYRIDGGARMRLPNTAHTSRPWRIHELTGDFRLEDVWALPTPGGPDDFPRLVQMMASTDSSDTSSPVVR